MLPLFAVVLRHGIPALGWPYIAGSGIVHAVYFYTLAEAYRDGDLSLIYPISRSVPIFVLLRFVFVWHDPIIVPGILGILIVVGGAYALQLRKTSLTDLAAPLRDIKRRRSTRLAWTTALLVATYSLIDDRGVGVVQPVLYLVVYGAVGLPAYTPVVLWRECSNLVSEWRASWRWILPAGLINPVGYLLVLLALRISYVGYVSSVRQISIVFGVILGNVLLGEPYGRLWLTASAIMFMGMLVIALFG